MQDNTVFETTRRSVGRNNKPRFGSLKRQRLSLKDVYVIAIVIAKGCLKDVYVYRYR